MEKLTKNLHNANIRKQYQYSIVLYIFRYYFQYLLLRLSFDSYSIFIKNTNIKPNNRYYIVSKYDFIGLICTFLR